MTRLAIDTGKNVLGVNARVAAMLISTALLDAGRNLSRSRLLEALSSTSYDDGTVSLDYKAFPLSGHDHVKLVTFPQAS
jgi:hypothetical protein